MSKINTKPMKYSNDGPNAFTVNSDEIVIIVQRIYNIEHEIIDKDVKSLFYK